MRGRKERTSSISIRRSAEMRECKRVDENVVERYVTSVMISFKIDSGFRRGDESDFLATRESSSTRVMRPCRRGWRKCCWMP
jgi:hypothetical protein